MWSKEHDWGSVHQFSRKNRKRGRFEILKPISRRRSCLYYCIYPLLSQEFTLFNKNNKSNGLTFIYGCGYSWACLGSEAHLGVKCNVGMVYKRGKTRGLLLVSHIFVLLATPWRLCLAGVENKGNSCF